jgi:hypothetical protein
VYVQVLHTDWLSFVRQPLTPICSVISHGNIVLDLCLSDLRPFFLEHNHAYTRALCTQISVECFPFIHHLDFADENCIQVQSHSIQEQVKYSTLCFE